MIPHPIPSRKTKAPRIGASERHGAFPPPIRPPDCKPHTLSLGGAGLGMGGKPCFARHAA